jgi:CCR4-NOT transcription complex subunit 9
MHPIVSAMLLPSYNASLLILKQEMCFSEVSILFRISLTLAHIPLFLYPFLNTTSKSRPFEYLRLTSLGVIGALVKSDSPPTIEFLLTTEIIPLCLRIMETGSELSKVTFTQEKLTQTVAIFILQKILLDDQGLQYICGTYDRFLAVAQVLSVMVNVLVEMQAVRLLKHVVRCYLRLSDHPKWPPKYRRD